MAEGLETLRFALAPDSFFTIVVTNDVLRGPLPGSMGLIPQNAANLPALLNASLHQLVLKNCNRAKPSELVVREQQSGFVFFNVEGSSFDYDARTHCSASVKEGCWCRKSLPPGLACLSEAESVAGRISIAATMRDRSNAAG